MKENYEKEPSNSLYHFTNLKTALEYILPNFNLRISPIVNTNDPREYKSFGFGAINGSFSVGNEIKEHKEWDDKVTKLLRKGVKVLCFSQDYENNNEWFDGYNLPRMWAQYGGNHTGVCFDIDKDKFINENIDLLKNTHFEPIKYKSKFKYPWISHDRMNNMGVEKYANEFRNVNLEYLFFQKFIDWEAEREVRFLKFSDEPNEDEFLSIKKSLNRIIIGCEFNQVYLPSLIKMCNGKRIDSLHYESGAFKSFQFRNEYIESLMKLKNN